MAVSKPIVTIAHAVRHVPLRVELDDIEGIAQNASEMLMNVRESMLAPHPRKRAPVFSTSQLAALCRIDRKKVNYYLGESGPWSSTRNDLT